MCVCMCAYGGMHIWRMYNKFQHLILYLVSMLQELLHLCTHQFYHCTYLANPNFKFSYNLPKSLHADGTAQNFSNLSSVPSVCPTEFVTLHSTLTDLTEWWYCYTKSANSIWPLHILCACLPLLLTHQCPPTRA